MRLRDWSRDSPATPQLPHPSAAAPLRVPIPRERGRDGRGPARCLDPIDLSEVATKHWYLPGWRGKQAMLVLPFRPLTNADKEGAARQSSPIRPQHQLPRPLSTPPPHPPHTIIIPPSTSAATPTLPPRSTYTTNHHRVHPVTSTYFLPTPVAAVPPCLVSRPWQPRLGTNRDGLTSRPSYHPLRPSPPSKESNANTPTFFLSLSLALLHINHPTPNGIRLDS